MQNTKDSKITCYQLYMGGRDIVMNVDTSILENRTYKVRNVS